MTETPEPGCRPGTRLPDLTLPTLDGGTVRWRSPAEGSPVVVFLHSPACSSCRSYLDGLARAAPDFRDWSGRVLVVFATADTGSAPEAGDATAQAWPFVVSVDEDGKARARCGIGEDHAAVIIADRWGEVYFAAGEKSERALPDPPAIEEWLRYLATQCPECGVPDESGAGEWAA